VRLIVDVNGTVAQRIDYDAYGRVLTNTNPGFQPFGYAGGVLDDATGLTRFGARDYEAEAGRWTSADLLGVRVGENLYQYAESIPTTKKDVSGLWPTVEDMANLSAGFGDILLFGQGERLRALANLGGIIDRCSQAYSIGQALGSLAPIGRLSYVSALAGLSAYRLDAAASEDLIAERMSRGRNSIRSGFQGPLSRFYPPPTTYEQLIASGRSSTQIIRSATRTNPFVNIFFGSMALLGASASEQSACACGR
jgi:RHS repeat-associated protein